MSTLPPGFAASRSRIGFTSMAPPLTHRRAQVDPSTPELSTAGHRPSDQFLAGLRHATRVTFVSHVQPDPDSLGSMLGLAHLVECRLGKPTRMTRDGLINRAENRAMAELLDLDLIPVEDLKFESGEAVV